MNKETLEILNGKNGKEAKQLLDFCSTPRDPTEVSSCNIKNAFEMLVKLKSLGTIVFKDGKYVVVES